MVHSHDFYNQYQDTYIQYSATYGPKVAVFLQKGAFYEFYGQQDTETGAHLNSFKEFTDILSCQVNVYEGDAPGGRTGFFAGVPDYTLDKWAGKLTGLGWTVIVITQDENSQPARAGSRMKRSVSRILSPGTHVENVETAAACYVGAYSTASGQALVLDVTTGAITYNSYPEHAAHYFQIYPPRELVVYGSCAGAAIEDLQKTLYITGQTITYSKPALPPAYSRPEQRTTYLQDTFKPRTLLPFASWLGLTPSLQELLTALLLWIEDHYASLVSRLPRPTPWHPGDKIRIINNALLQLNINGQTQTTIEKLITTPYSAPGRRAIHAALATPYADPEKILAKQREVAWISGSAYRKAIVNDLKQLHDFPRIHRSIARGVIKAGGVLQLYQSLKIMRGLHDRMGVDNPFISAANDTIGNGLELCIATCDELFDQTKALKSQDAPQDWGFLKDGVGPQTAAVEQAIARIHTETAEWLRGLSLGSGLDLAFKPTDKSDYAVHMTKVAINAVQAYTKTLPKTDPYAACVFKALSSGGRLEHPWLDTQQVKLDAQRANLRRIYEAELMRTCISYSDKTHEYTGALEDWVVHIDHAATYAATNEKYNWVSPTIESNCETSGLDIKGLRHPLIEIQKTHIELITHDIALDCVGAGANAGAKSSVNTNHGLLLYGINASGKSSLMKAVGIAVVLAQLGFGVPALSMTLRPYKKIASRILNQDNLWAGLSSFAVEMVELRELLTAADAHTLVLGDELCAGTESVSATAIVGASINALLEARSSFILATHLHDLNKVAAVTDAVGLQIAHLKVHYDVARDLLVYDRTLAPGPGSANYGLTVAKALHLPPAVLETAYTYRRLLTGDTHQMVDTTNTSYNASVIRKSCAACGSAITRDLEVHHIQEQAYAGAGANATNKTNADGTALHGLRNLVVVCRTCHDEHHAGKLHIGPVRQTSAGPERIIERTSATPKPTTTIGDLGEEDIAHIVEIATAYPNLSTKLLLFQIKERHGLDVTSTQIATLRRKKII